MVSQCPSFDVRRPSFVVRRAASTIALNSLLLLHPWPMDSILGKKHQSDLWIKNSENLSDRKSKMAAMTANLKIIFFFASSPESKGQLTSNLLGSIGVTYRSKKAKIVPIRNPGWPAWQSS